MEEQGRGFGIDVSADLKLEKPPLSQGGFVASATLFLLRKQPLRRFLVTCSALYGSSGGRAGQAVQAGASSWAELYLFLDRYLHLAVVNLRIQGSSENNCPAGWHRFLAVPFRCQKSL